MSTLELLGLGLGGWFCLSVLVGLAMGRFIRKGGGAL
jgi:hypothetical protein